MKYRTCYCCGKKPKSYRTDYGEWNLDHECRFQTGRLYVGGDELKDVMTFWNDRQLSLAESPPSASAQATHPTEEDER